MQSERMHAFSGMSAATEEAGWCGDSRVLALSKLFCQQLKYAYPYKKQAVILVLWGWRVGVHRRESMLSAAV